MVEADKLAAMEELVNSWGIEGILEKIVEVCEAKQDMALLRDLPVAASNWQDRKIHVAFALSSLRRMNIG